MPFDQLFLKLIGKFSAIRNSLINEINHAKTQSAQGPQKSQKPEVQVSCNRTIFRLFKVDALKRLSQKPKNKYLLKNTHLFEILQVTKFL